MRSLLGGNAQITAPSAVPEGSSSVHSGRVIAAFSFSRNLPNKWIVEKLAQALHAETGESVLLLRMVSTRDNLSVCRTLDDVIDGDFHFRESLPKPEGSFARLSLKITGGSREAAHVAPLLSNLSRHFDYVLVEAATENISLPPLLEFVIQADTSYLFLNPAPSDLKNFDAFLGNLRSRARGNCSDINPVICLAPGERFADQTKLNNGSAHAFVHDCPVSPANGFT